MEVLRTDPIAFPEEFCQTAVRLVYRARYGLHGTCVAREQPDEPSDDAGFADALLRVYAHARYRPADRERQRLLGTQAAFLGCPPVGAEMASFGDVRVYGLAVRFRESQGRRRLAGAFRHQPALPAPVVVYDGGRGQARLSGQHLLPVALVETVQICRGLLLASGRHAESGSACLRRARRQSDRERLESGVRAFVQRAVARCARDRRDGG